MFILQFPGSNGGWGKSGGGGYRRWKRSIVLRGGIECLNRSWVDACIIQSCKGLLNGWSSGHMDYTDGPSYVIEGCRMFVQLSSQPRREGLPPEGETFSVFLEQSSHSVRSHRGNHVPRLKLAIVG